MLLSRWQPAIALWDIGLTKWTSLMLACHTEDFNVTPSPWNGFKTCENFQLVLCLRLAFLCLCVGLAFSTYFSTPYLSPPPHPQVGTGALHCFLILSGLPFCFSLTFSPICCLFCDSWCLSFLYLCRIMSVICYSNSSDSQSHLEETMWHPYYSISP
jgi:hypothetical protein